MSKRKKIVTISILLFISVILLSSWAVNKWKKSQEMDYSKVLYYEEMNYSMIIGNIRWLNQEKWALVSYNTPKINRVDKQIDNILYLDGRTNFPIIGKEYILSSEYKTKFLNTSNKENLNKETNEQYLSSKVTIYKNNDKREKIKEIDLFKAAQKNKIGKSISHAILLSKDEKYFSFYSYDTMDSRKYQTYYYEIETDKILLEEEMNKENIWIIDENLRPNEYQYLSKTDFLEKNNIFEKGITPIMMLPAQRIDFNFKKKVATRDILLLEKKYPEIEERLNQKETTDRLYFLEDSPSGQELAELLTPEGKDPFTYEGKVVIESTGEEVTSVTDFLEKWHKKNEK